MNLNGTVKSDFLPVLGVGKAESKTACKFKAPFVSKDMPHAVSINVDWLALMTECGLQAPAPENQKPIWVNDSIVLEYQGKGTPVFNYSWKVYQDGEPVAYVHTHSKNKKIIKENTAKMEIFNQVLYSSELKQVIDNVMTACKMTVIKNISRLDISIDGANHIPVFLNQYVKHRQNGGERIHRNGKAHFSPRIFDEKTASYKSFKIGSSRKSIVVYNKTQELEISHKEYIRQAWDRAGLDLTSDVWRTEMRLSSEALKEVEGGFNLEQINNPLYLLTFFRTQAKNFFEFVDMRGQTNVTYGTVIDLLQFEKLKIPLLQKIPRAITDGAYKAKMAIHNGIKQIYQNVHRVKTSIDAVLTNVADNIDIYNLERWYTRKLPQWELQYSNPFTDPGSHKLLYLMQRTGV